MYYQVYDLAIIVILALFIWSGIRRGLILSLCGLLAVVVAFLGANFLASFCAPVVAEHISPMIQSSIIAQFEDTSAESMVNEETLDELDSSFLVKLILHADQELNLFSEVKEIAVSQFAAQVSDTIAGWIAHTTVFLAAFLIILILWLLISRALDLVARLPGLHFLNKSLGGVFGGLKGIVILFALAWVLRYLWNILPDDAIEHSPLLHFFMTTDPFSLIASWKLPQI